jgi:hypothetical protein
MVYNGYIDIFERTKMLKKWWEPRFPMHPEFLRAWWCPTWWLEIAIGFTFRGCLGAGIFVWATLIGVVIFFLWFFG